MDTTDKHRIKATDLEHILLESIPIPVIAVDKDFNILFINSAGCDWCKKEFEEAIGKKCFNVIEAKCCSSSNCGIKEAMDSGKKYTGHYEIPHHKETINIEITAVPLKDENGKIVGGLEYITDITSKVKMENELRTQTQTILELATPVIKIWDGILLLPLVGIVDTARAQQIIENLLNSIVENEAELAILDLTGVPVVDTAVARHIIKTVNAAKMLGAQTILTGFSPEVSQTLVTLGVDLSNITTCGSLKTGISKAFSLIGKKVVSYEG
ncbi:RsbR, positive regulator of sigma-B [Methanosarcina horonobensis HB-1 = JCM 15518]|uniref:RsbR, positive regulator of sigma-B n=1 Tax=Methanosarcina horonobensis HB-1 = JCM 15518 TaxID=1434110 RepID=A0A0E3S8Y5_9EURY|nr:PAS domain-containing protein [Methanosarcina horonobensis]AKB77126.1 RsbR, positive regulator of sigma-B [Methanosarcina horonobensis HB-1 = JCM 15518]